MDISERLCCGPPAECSGGLPQGQSKGCLWRWSAAGQQRRHRSLSRWEGACPGNPQLRAQRTPACVRAMTFTDGLATSWMTHTLLLGMLRPEWCEAGWALGQRTRHIWIGSDSLLWSRPPLEPPSLCDYSFLWTLRRGRSSDLPRGLWYSPLHPLIGGFVLQDAMLLLFCFPLCFTLPVVCHLNSLTSPRCPVQLCPGHLANEFLGALTRVWLSGAGVKALSPCGTGAEGRAGVCSS